MFFKKKNVIKAPVEGRLMDVTNIPDETFASGLMGPTYAIKPTDNNVCAPVSGTISMIADSLHAFGIEGDTGVEILIHIGVDTVKLAGEGFEQLLKSGQRVQAGDPVIKFDREFVENNNLENAVMVIILNGDDYTINNKNDLLNVSTKDDIAMYHNK